MYRHEIDATGQPMSPDPYHAIENAIEHYRIDEILISTLKGEQSKWLEEGLIEKVQQLTDKPLEHIESGTEPFSATKEPAACRRRGRRPDGDPPQSPSATRRSTTLIRRRPTRARG